MKKNICCTILAMALLLISIPTFADTRNYSIGYSSPMKHQYNISFTKGSSEAWLTFTDHANESYFIDTSNNNSVSAGYHNTLIVDSGNHVLAGVKAVLHNSSASFNLNSTDAINKSTIRVRIGNPEYNGSNTVLYVKTKGNITYAKATV